MKNVSLLIGRVCILVSLLWSVGCGFIIMTRGLVSTNVMLVVISIAFGGFVVGAIFCEDVDLRRRKRNYIHYDVCSNETFVGRFFKIAIVCIACSLGWVLPVVGIVALFESDFQMVGGFIVIMIGVGLYYLFVSAMNSY